jgi:AAA ATPase domain
MDPVKNPYTPGAGSKPPALTGRDEEIEAFRVLLERLKVGRPEKSMLITGLRGVGKTVLLNTFEALAENAGFCTAKNEITADTEFRPMITRMARRVIFELSPLERMKDKAKRAAGIVKSFSLGGVEVTIDVEAVTGKADSGNLSEDISDLFMALGTAAQDHERGVVMLLDEIQFLSREDLSGLIAGLHHVAQKGVPLILVGAGLPQIPALAGTAKSYAERLFNFPEIGKLSVAAAKDALQLPAAEQGGSYDAPALRAILKFTEGYPYFLQEYGKHVWNIAPGPDITAKDVKRAQTAVRAQLDENFFRVRIGRTTKAELKYLSAMAALGAGQYRSGDIAGKLERPVESVAPLRATLIEKGLIYSPSHGFNDFTVPQFDDFLRRNYPLRTEE